MSIEVIGAGFGRTGTLSLKFALEKLGYDACYHMLEVHKHPSHSQVWIEAANGALPQWEKIFAGYKATVDWPSCNYWQEQMQAFPEAKVILSRRPAEDWYKSVMNTIYKFSVVGRDSGKPGSEIGWQLANDTIWHGIFGGRMEDKDHVIACYEAHNKKVIDTVPEEKLLVYQPGDGWEPLCSFLGCKVPDEPYPNTNSSAEFTARWQSVRSVE